MRLPLSAFLLVACIVKASEALHVYLSPTRTYLSSTLSPGDASFALSRHLGLEVFEPFRDSSDLSHDDEHFVGQGGRNAVLVTVDERYAKRPFYLKLLIYFLTKCTVILPDALRLAFTMVTPTSTPISSVSSVISTYLNRASHLFSSVFPSKPFDHLDDIDTLEAYFYASEEPAFAAVDLSNLLAISKVPDQTSEELSKRLRSFLEHISQDDRYNLAVLTYATPSSTSLFKRDASESQAPLPSGVPPQLPIGSISTCFASLDACNNDTSSCSGRGQCVKASKAGRTCFVCNCGLTKSGEGKNVKTEYWAGEKCERKDISGYVLENVCSDCY